MPDTTRSDYTVYDHPDIVSVLFYPRKDTAGNGQHSTIRTFFIPVEGEQEIGATFHASGRTSSPTILFFHGNGEIVSDYNEIGGIFIKQGANFLPVDYRGYGQAEADGSRRLPQY